MTKLNKILIAALGAQIVLIAVVWASRDAATIADPESVIADFEPDEIERVEIFESGDDEDDEGGEETAVVALSRDGDGFRLDSAHGYPADAERVETLLGAVSNMSSREPIATSEGRARQLEVASDAYDRKLVFHTAGGDTHTLYVGTSAGRGRIAARLEGDEAIHAVDSSVGRSAGVPREDWAKQPFFEVQVDGITSLSVENENLRAAFVRNDEGAWELDPDASEIEIPDGHVLDGDAVKKIARAIASIRLKGVAGSEPAPEHGLDEPSARIELAIAPPEPGGDAGVSVAEDRRTLLFGSDTDENIHLTDASQSFVVLVGRSAVADALDAKAEDLFSSEEELAEKEEEAAEVPAPPGLPGGAQVLPPSGNPGAIAPPTP